MIGAGSHRGLLAIQKRGLGASKQKLLPDQVGTHKPPTETDAAGSCRRTSWNWLTVLPAIERSTTGWWFGTCFFPYIENNHPHWLIFFRGFKPPTSTISSRFWLSRAAQFCPKWMRPWGAWCAWPTGQKIPWEKSVCLMFLVVRLEGQKTNVIDTSSLIVTIIPLILIYWLYLD